MADGNPPGEEDCDIDDDPIQQDENNLPIMPSTNPEAPTDEQQPGQVKVPSEILTATPSTIADLPSTEMQSLLTNESPKLEPLDNDEVFQWRGNGKQQQPQVQPATAAFDVDKATLSPSVINDLPSTTVVSLHLEQKDLKPIENSEAFLYQTKTPSANPPKIKSARPASLKPSPAPVTTTPPLIMTVRSPDRQVQKNASVTPPHQGHVKPTSQREALQTRNIPNRPQPSRPGSTSPTSPSVSPSSPVQPPKLGKTTKAYRSQGQSPTTAQQARKASTSPVVTRSGTFSPISAAGGSSSVNSPSAGNSGKRPTSKRGKGQSNTPNSRASRATNVPGGKNKQKNTQTTTTQTKKSTTKNTPNQKTTTKQKQNNRNKNSNVGPFTSYVFRPPPKEG